LGEICWSDIEDEDIIDHLEGMAKDRPKHARHVHVYLQGAFRWLASPRRRLINRNPLAGIEAIGTRGRRERNLADTEISLFWRSCEQIGWPFGPLFQLLLLGCRRSELARATWTEFDLQARTWELPGTRTKNSNPHVTHLPWLALDIITGLPHVSNPSNYLFCTMRRSSARPVSGFSDAAERVHALMEEAAGIRIDGFSRHDLRRTFSTGMAKLGVR